MAAATAERPRRFETWKHKDFILASGFKAWKGTRAMLDPITGKVRPATAVTGLLAIGIFNETIDAAAGDKTISVDLEDEIVVERFANDTAGNAVLATDVGKIAYHTDDNTVSITSLGKSQAGRIWDVDAVKGVAIERIDATPLGRLPAVAAFVANDFAPATIAVGALFDVPTTAAASTITLPTAAPDGTVAYFFADGVKNGHTVQYRDQDGPLALTTALIASKRHLVVVAKRDAKWAANAYVSP